MKERRLRQAYRPDQNVVFNCSNMHKMAHDSINISETFSSKEWLSGKGRLIVARLAFRYSNELAFSLNESN